MKLNIEDHVESIIQAKNGREQTWHMWLSGFYQIINNSILNFQKIEEYLEEKLQEHPPFTKFKSSTQLLKVMQAYFKKFDFSSPIPLHKLDLPDKNQLDNFPTMPDLIYVHLPISDKYHLEFPLIKQDNKCRFVYTSCPDCEALEEHGFPEISLRQSANFEDDEEAQKAMKRGTFMYDNRISVNHQDKETIIESYLTLQNFIEATKLG